MQMCVQHLQQLHPAVMFTGSILGYLEVADDDDDEVTFAIQGQIAQIILELNQIEPLKAEILLRSPLDYEVWTTGPFLWLHNKD